jgi:hypothetical protein
VSEHDEREDYDDDPWRKRATPEELLRTPASIIAAFGAIQLGFSVVGCLALVALIIWSLFNDIGADTDPEDGGLYEFLAVISISILSVLWNWVIVRGAGRMRKCRNYRLSVAAAVLSIFSVPFYYCLPISAGVAVWTLVILSRRDVRARFAAVARGTISSAPPEAPDARTD